MKRYFSKEHEWVLVPSDDEKSVKIGISDYAQGNLGDIVYIDMPSVGKTAAIGEEIAVVESAKAASDIFAPITGAVVEVNTALEEQPDLVNNSPLDEGWLFTMSLDKPEELQSLMSEEEYEAYITEL